MIHFHKSKRDIVDIYCIIPDEKDKVSSHSLAIAFIAIQNMILWDHPFKRNPTKEEQ